MKWTTFLMMKIIFTEIGWRNLVYFIKPLLPVVWKVRNYGPNMSQHPLKCRAATSAAGRIILTTHRLANKYVYIYIHNMFMNVIYVWIYIYPYTYAKIVYIYIHTYMYMYTYGFCISNGKSSQLALTEPSHLHLPTPPCETDERHAAEGHLQSDQKAPGAACLTGKEHVEITSHGDGSKPMKYLWNTYEIPMKYLWTSEDEYHEYHESVNHWMGMDQHLRLIPPLGGWTSLNPSSLGATPPEPCGAMRSPNSPTLMPHPPPAPRPFFGTLPVRSVPFASVPFASCGLGVLASDQPPQGAAAGEPAHVGAVGDQAARGLEVMVLLEQRASGCYMAMV